MTAAELDAFLHREFPQVDGQGYRVEEMRDRFARLRLPFHEGHLRPGGTVSGPTLMSLADTAMYVVVLAMIGEVPLAVTTSLNINFMRRPGPVDVIADARILKLGRRLAVGDVALYSDGDPEMVAHATLTYSIPDKR
ncbi:MAG: PaaI family thioesterase [Deltaproteobacteria bacterium]|nr:PaaI family thioesterase [Deltaproteobacteria bacterium]